MDVFGLRSSIIERYDQYVKGFSVIQDTRLREAVHHELDNGLLWPDPSVQINPGYKPGANIVTLVKDNTLHPTCEKVFRANKNKDGGKPLELYFHQVEALAAAKRGEHYVVTTGTGSGKSLTYIVPIVDHVLRNGSGKGVQALIVYPMNALANSQVGELDKFLREGFSKQPVTFRRYTGQEKEEERQEILANPPDILLTNYVMLELMLTRQAESSLMQAAKGLRFLVFDELHTYRGRQGSDVAMLIRRVRDQLEAPNVQCIGTSATIAGSGDDPRVAVADYAGRVFGVNLPVENVIQETLRRATPELGPQAAKKLKDRLAKGHTGPFADDPLAAWMESKLGLAERKNRLVRAVPRPIGGATGLGHELSAFTGEPQAKTEAALRDVLIRSYEAARHGDEAGKAFAFRLHQFITRGGTPHVTVASQANRTISMGGQPRDPANPDHWMFPVVFCRECGKDYLVAWYGKSGLRPRPFMDRLAEDGEEPMYVYIDDARPWNEDDKTQLPEDWFDEKGKLKSSRKPSLPVNRTVLPTGEESASGLEITLVPYPFRFCLSCKVSYNFRQRSDYGKLASLDSEARSTATTILTQAALHGMRQTDLPLSAQKLLSFTDNRQDASLQAGHFNDFNTVSIIRSAVSRALEANPGGLTTEQLPGAVLDALGLQLNDYSLAKNLEFGHADDVKQVMRNVLAHRIFRDLQRGWRVTSPNLEQSGLLRIEYPYLTDVCKDPTKWANTHPGIQAASPEIRQTVASALLDHMRRELCIKIEALDPEAVLRLQTRSNDQLEWQWAIDPDEKPAVSKRLVPRSREEDDKTKGIHFVGPQSNFGLFVKRHIKNPDGSKLSQEDTGNVIEDILRALQPTGLVVPEPQARGDPVYRLDAWRWKWLPGDGKSGAVDPLRTPGLEKARTNEFFVHHYRETAIRGVGLRSQEHTAQVGDEDRIKRENQFREGTLPLLFCSPTMELGVDIAQLNVVNMRNVPPTPANYAQRSGRAGRSGQPAFVFTYCSRTSPHDQYFFQRPHQMVSGAVHPPSIDLQNEDLVRAHIHGIWLKESNLDLKQSLAELVETQDLSKEKYLTLAASYDSALRNPVIRAKAKERAMSVLRLAPEILEAEWYNDKWLDRVLETVRDSFDRSLDRWRTLVKGARQQLLRQADRLARAGADSAERKQAERLQREASAQLGVLMNEVKDQRGDFYPYRYLAAEGFLPGYNFPRLPISAFIPGRKGTRHSFLNRPRFIAVSEFGPRSIIYHEGSKYRITKTQQPPSPDGDATGMVTSEAKLCDSCGRMHEVERSEDVEVCELCGETTLTHIPNLFRMEGVGTVRVQHINSDEEERRRLGFEVRTTIRPAKKSRSTKLSHDGTEIAAMEYSPAADIWKINLGERRRKDKTPAGFGFKIDPKTGTWARSAQDDDDYEEELDRPVQVVPYVHDTANALIFRPTGTLDNAAMATLQAALSAAIQARFHMEDRELDASPLPSTKERKVLLFYESSAGGAGVLRRLLDHPDAIRDVASAALDILHFDANGTDRGKNSRGEPCGAACYDCVLSYQNQRDHQIVDRRLVRDVLLQLAGSTFDRSGIFESLSGQCETELERWWLLLLQQNGLTPPNGAQHRHPEMKTNPDFCYHHEAHTVHIYVDGPHHDEADTKRRDTEINERLKGAGRHAIRFPVVYKKGTENLDMWDRVVDRPATKEAWMKVLASRPDVFGQVQVVAK